MTPPTRRKFCGTLSVAPFVLRAAHAGRRPNVILVITDDQGFGDLSLHGNSNLKTPHMDGIATAGVQFTQFQVSPVCSPTRSSLLTGRYNYRTGVVDTYLGRSLMYPDEATVAELFGSAGYRTGIFGKWHLGDNYPMRAIDQGFQEALVLKGGGLAQPSDPPESRSSYFDPVLQYNGKADRRRGYCTDIFFYAAGDFVEENRKQPFFLYVAPNAPHTPLQVEDSWVAPFRKMGLQEDTAKAYGMVANLDMNLGRLLARVRTAGIEQDTIVIFMSDNGVQGKRYNSGMRGVKGTVFQGGIRAPFFVRWPGLAPRGRKVDRIAAHIDVLPTLIEACGVTKPAGLQLDGKSLLPLIRGEQPTWPDRTLYAQWHRGDEPVLFRNCAARSQRYKLVDGRELYDLEGDPAESRDISATHSEVVAKMRKDCEDWFRDVSSTRGYAPSRIHIGTSFENPATLTRQDWRGPTAGWAENSLGYWEVDVRQAGRYRVKLRMPAVAVHSQAVVRLSGVELEAGVQRGATECVLGPVAISKGPGRLEAFLAAGESRSGVHYVDVIRE
jgi:arylsulfatase A-like enzyme